MYQNCRKGNCVNFDIGSYGLIYSTSSLDTPTELSINVWINFNYLDYSSSQGILHRIAMKGNCDTTNPSLHSGWWFSYENRNNGNSFSYTCFGNSNGGYNGGGNNMVGSQIYFNTSSWYMITLVVKDNQAKIFVNGNQVGPTKNLTNLQLNDMLNRNMYLPYYVKAKIDESRIYNRALSEAEIKAIYNATK